jgi:CheY-like chemotaxis protein
MTLRLLIADDSVTIHQVVQLAFQETDTVVESVTNGDDVGQALYAFRPNAVLADISMPGVNGYQICSMIKEDPDFSDIPVVLLVGTFESFDESEAARVRYDARLTKPFDPSELVHVVHTLVGRNVMHEQPASGPEPSSTKDQVLSRTQGPLPGVARKRMRISRRCLDSFVGENKVLDLFEKESAKEGLKPLEPKRLSSAYAREENAEKSEAMRITAEMITEEALETIVERVVRKMSTDVVSEIAWEIVPELSEIMIRRSLEEKSEG